MLIWTIGTLLAEAQLGERNAYWSIQVDFYVGISAVGFCATTTDEVNAGGSSIGRKVMRKSTCGSRGAGTFHKELLAYSNLVDIVGELAIPGTLA